MKTCQYCKSEVPEDAVKCKFCWEFLENKYKNSWIRLYKKSFQFNPKIYCPNCWYEWKTSKTKRPWSDLLTLIGFLFAIIPGIIYEISRWKRYYICPKCKSDHVNKIN